MNTAGCPACGQRLQTATLCGHAVLRCVTCGGLWLRHFNDAHDSGVDVARCQHCDGTWLQPGQLAQIVKYRAATPTIRALERSLVADMRAARRWRLVGKWLRFWRLSGAYAALTIAVAALAWNDGYRITPATISVLFACPLVPSVLPNRQKVARRWLARIGRTRDSAVFGSRSPVTSEPMWPSP